MGESLTIGEAPLDFARSQNRRNGLKDENVFADRGRDVHRPEHPRPKLPCPYWPCRFPAWFCFKSELSKQRTARPMKMPWLRLRKMAGRPWSGNRMLSASTLLCLLCPLVDATL